MRWLPGQILMPSFSQLGVAGGRCAERAERAESATRLDACSSHALLQFVSSSLSLSPDLAASRRQETCVPARLIASPVSLAPVIERGSSIQTVSRSRLFLLLDDSMRFRMMG
jgi:hypothetical protein